MNNDYGFLARTIRDVCKRTEGRICITIENGKELEYSVPISTQEYEILSSINKYEKDGIVYSLEMIMRHGEDVIGRKELVLDIRLIKRLDTDGVWRCMAIIANEDTVLAIADSLEQASSYEYIESSASVKGETWRNDRPKKSGQYLTIVLYKDENGEKKHRYSLRMFGNIMDCKKGIMYGEPDRNLVWYSLSTDKGGEKVVAWMEIPKY